MSTAQSKYPSCLLASANLNGYNAAIATRASELGTEAHTPAGVGSSVAAGFSSGLVLGFGGFGAPCESGHSSGKHVLHLLSARLVDDLIHEKVTVH
jgi:hypothetical protein